MTVTSARSRARIALLVAWAAASVLAAILDATGGLG